MFLRLPFILFRFARSVKSHKHTYDHNDQRLRDQHAINYMVNFEKFPLRIN